MNLRIAVDAENVLMLGCALCPSALLSFPGQEHGPSRPRGFRQKSLFFALAGLPLHLDSSPATRAVPVHRGGAFDGQSVSVAVGPHLSPHRVSLERDRALKEQNFRFPLLAVVRPRGAPTVRLRLLRGRGRVFASCG